MEIFLKKKITGGGGGLGRVLGNEIWPDYAILQKKKNYEEFSQKL